MKNIIRGGERDEVGERMTHLNSRRAILDAAEQKLIDAVVVALLLGDNMTEAIGTLLGTDDGVVDLASLDVAKLLGGVFGDFAHELSVAELPGDGLGSRINIDLRKDHKGGAIATIRQRAELARGGHLIVGWKVRQWIRLAKKDSDPYSLR